MQPGFKPLFSDSEFTEVGFGQVFPVIFKKWPMVMLKKQNNHPHIAGFLPWRWEWTMALGLLKVVKQTKKKKNAS